MSNNIYQLRTPVEATSNPVVGEVLVADGGEARVVSLGDTGSLKVFAHLAATPWLNPGDQVLVQCVREGAVIINRLRRNDEPIPDKLTHLPFNLDEQNGVVTLDAPRGLVLKVGESKIELTEDGQIRIDGQQITGVAKGRMSLQGITVALN